MLGSPHPLPNHTSHTANFPEKNKFKIFVFIFLNFFFLASHSHSSNMTNLGWKFPGRSFYFHLHIPEKSDEESFR